MAGIDRLAEVMGVENDFDEISESKFLYEVADEIQRLRAALAAETERCAKLAETIAKKCLDEEIWMTPFGTPNEFKWCAEAVCRRVAWAIRETGKGNPLDIGPLA